MRYSKPLLVLAMVGVMLVGSAAPVAAHDWQTTVTQGDMELGISSTPATPIAGMQTEFAARIMDNGSIEGEENRLSWGGVVNKEVEVHINGPDGIHDHVGAAIPEDDAHFHFAYAFPEAGTYTITVVTTIEGDEYAFAFERDVRLIPARAEGETVENIDSSVADLKQSVADLQSQVETLEQQNEELKTDLQELNEAHETEAQDETSSAAVPGFGLTVGLVALAAILAFQFGRRT